MPKLRFSSVVLSGRMTDSLWPHILGLELGDRITVKRTPPPSGDRLIRECHIEGIRHEIALGDDKQEWITTWSLSPADEATVWILGDSTMACSGRPPVSATKPE